jgi:DnaA-like protein
VTSALATLDDQARHYAAVRARLWGPPRRQFIKREWSTPTIVEIPKPSDQIDWVVREVMSRDRITASDIIDIVSLAYALPRIAILGRGRRYATPRHLAMVLVYRTLRDRVFGPFSIVGRVFDRDHTTALYAVRKLGPLIESIVSALPPPSSLQN